MEKRTFRRIGFGMFVVVAVFQLLGTLVVSFAYANNFDINIATIVGTCGFYLTGPVILWLFVRRLPTCEQPFRRRFLWWEILGLIGLCQAVTIPLNILGMGLNALVSTLLGGDGSSALIVSDMLNNTPFGLGILFIGVLSPFFEELVFRGILLKPLRPFGEKTAILVSSVIFGLFHCNFTQFFYAAVLGAIFAYVTLKSGSIRTAVVLHMMINSFSVVLSYCYAIGDDYFSMLPALGMLVLEFIAIGGGVLFAVMRRKQFFLLPAPYRFSRPVNGRLIFLNIGMILYAVLCIGLALVTAATY